MWQIVSQRLFFLALIIYSLNLLIGSSALYAPVRDIIASFEGGDKVRALWGSKKRESTVAKTYYCSEKEFLLFSQ